MSLTSISTSSGLLIVTLMSLALTLRFFDWTNRWYDALYNEFAAGHRCGVRLTPRGDGIRWKPHRRRLAGPKVVLTRRAAQADQPAACGARQCHETP